MANNISVYLNTLRQKGYLAYEYNPFHNYQTNVNLYLYDNKYLIPEGCAINLKNGMILHRKNGNWVDDLNNILENNDPNIITQTSLGVSLLYTAGSLIDLDTDKLNFDLNHPVDITVQPSYDGSVNLILNDGKNIPRLINSRFSAREKGTYEIVDRIGENDTNIYGSETFDKDTSLYFQYEKNPLVEYQGLYEGGDLLAGAYCYYFTYCDADDNESDIIAETGIIHVFIGTNGYPESVEGGIKNMNTHKLIVLQLSNLDKSYNYLKVYLVRYLADYGQNRVSECKKLILRYPIKSSKVTLQIKGNENSEDMDANLLNLSMFNPKDILTLALCKNMLFFGNIHKNADNYKELLDCALRIIPNIEPTTLKNIDNNYKTGGTTSAYYNSNNIYNLTGYFNNEYYRFGVVFIYKNGTLSNVYNTLGGVLTESKINYISEDNNVNTLYEDSNSPILVRKYIQTDDFGWIKNVSNFFLKGDDSNIEYANARGVCKLNWKESTEAEITDDTVFGINFTIPPNVVKFLKEDLGIRGLFFVRQKRISNLIAQCYLMPFDDLLEAPVLEVVPDSTNPDQRDYYTECFLTQGKNITITFRTIGRTYTRTYLIGDREVSNDYSSRLYKYQRPKENISSHAYAAICPDFLLNQPYYNLIFNNSKFELEKATKNGFLQVKGEPRQFTENPKVTYLSSNTRNAKEVTICSVTEDVPTIAIDDYIYRLEKGKADEVYRFKYAEIDKSAYNAGDEDFDIINAATNLVRGKYSPYLAIYSPNKLDTSELYNIYAKGNRTNVRQNITDRMNDYSGFYAISDRYNFESMNLDSNKQYNQTCYRGDCYINTFTYRLNRNFNDKTLPNNDTIIDGNTWKENYDVEDPSKWSNIYRSDVNAVLMGSWITFKCRSYMNYALRSLDYSYVSEAATMGSPRTYFPKTKMGWKGENKMPDSYVFNDAYRTSLGYKCYYTLLDINYIKDCFSNRIQYSAVAVLDSYKNNYRQSYSTYFRDYSLEYGSIQKLIGFEGHLLVVLEHAIGLAVINERVLAGTGDGEPVFINTQNVLPEELTILTDTYGTQWPESVIKTETGTVYGVDTIAKKIWKVTGQLIEIISDFSVNKFLVDNITLGERERYPIIGLRNVKTHYNNNKKDVMFTFYDDIYKGEEKVWNLCYNELLGKFITFYSWIPSYSENIDTQFFTFDRKVSKELSLLDKCNYANPNNTGVLVDPVVLKPNSNGEYIALLHYVTEKIESIKAIAKDDYKISTDKAEILCVFRREHDSALNWKYFEIEDILDENDNTKVIGSNLKLIVPPDITHTEGIREVIDKTGLLQIYDVLNSWNSRTFTLEITPIINSTNTSTSLTNTGFSLYFKTETIAVTLEGIVNNHKGTGYTEGTPTLNTDFFLHGLAGIFDLSESLFPTHWYGEYHPFEFEFVVNEKTGIQKVFYNLEIISNKAEPESFHFLIEGDNYEFSADKRAMYYRQEATKEIFLNLGSNMLFDRDYKDVAAKNFTYEQYYRGNPIRGEGNNMTVSNEYKDLYSKRDRVYPVESHGLVQQVKSTIFPLYYERIDTYNDIYHIYRGMLDGNPDTGYDFKNLSGSEILWDKRLNQFNIVTHIKNSPINLYGRLRGNSFYKEGKWFVQIPSIIFNQKNESPWGTTSSEFLLDYSELDSEAHLQVQGQADPLAIPPLVINSSNIPNDLSSLNITPETLPSMYRNYNTVDNYEGQDTGFYSTIDTKSWTGRKEARIRDKWIKIRVRYSGKNLAIIHSIITLFNISPS